MENIWGRKGYDYDDDDNDGKSHWSDVKKIFLLETKSWGYVAWRTCMLRNIDVRTFIYVIQN